MQVSKHAATVGGSSAKLRTGDILSVWDLLHGLMLPSGNDAAVTLAEHFGHYLYEVATKYKNGNKNEKDTTNGTQVSQPEKDNNGADGHNQTTATNPS